MTHIRPDLGDIPSFECIHTGAKKKQDKDPKHHSVEQEMTSPKHDLLGLEVIEKVEPKGCLEESPELSCEKKQVKQQGKYQN